MSAPNGASTTGHIPVMLNEVLAALRPRDGAIYVDGTFGGGSYSRALLEEVDCTVWGIDRDTEALERASGLTKRFAGKLHLVSGSFGSMDELLGSQGIDAVDGIALDVGVSSMQLNAPQRGFSFRLDGPLDMRMSSAGPSAADVVNEEPERPLEALLGPGGRLAVVSFHSLEDREVKSFLRARAGARERGSRHAPPSNATVPEPTFRLLHRAPVVPTATEVEINPRARSARLRSAERTAAPSWSEKSAGEAA